MRPVQGSGGVFGGMTVIKRTELLDWVVGYKKTAESNCEKQIPATVPGAVQLDWAAAVQAAPFWYGTHYKDYAWMEDCFWVYRCEAAVEADSGVPLLHFTGIDYRYCIALNGEIVYEYEGMVREAVLDLRAYRGRRCTVEVTVFPAPKKAGCRGRDQAAACCKPAVAYGWDFHPRLIPLGICGEVYIEYVPEGYIRRVDIDYRLTEDLSSALVTFRADCTADGGTLTVQAEQDGEIVQERTYALPVSVLSFALPQVKLWWPAGFGDQPLYRFRFRLTQNGQTHEIVRTVGFRRMELLPNAGAGSQWETEPGVKTRLLPPLTVCVNGRRLFAKGTNWVPPDIFPARIDREMLARHLRLIRDCHMNIVRVWGGGAVNRPEFFSLCDEMGLLVIQEFPLACNAYPDDDRYLAVLKSEAEAIIDRAKNHPCLCAWSGGNELFNSWSGMNDQSHALRLLNALCYEKDRTTPFWPTSPTEGIGHGSYINAERDGTECLTWFRRTDYLAYNEFGNPSASSADYVRRFMSEEEFSCPAPGTVWEDHHGFRAWCPDSWLRFHEADTFFGGYTDYADYARKSQLLQGLCCRALFEEVRCRWPHTSMAMNWCFQEPWPTAANNSLVNWGGEPKASLPYAADALRDQKACLRTERLRFVQGEDFAAELFVLNDLPTPLPAAELTVTLCCGETRKKLLCWAFPGAEGQRHTQGPTVKFSLSETAAGLFTVTVDCAQQPELNAVYTYFCRET